MKPRFFPNAAEFGRWLDAHASSALEIWVGYYKVGGKPSLTWPESVDQALCHGKADPGPLRGTSRSPQGVERLEQ